MDLRPRPSAGLMKGRGTEMKMKTTSDRIADNLRYLRRYASASQEDAAAAAGVSRNMYIRYETGASVPPVDKLSALARYFRVPLRAITERDLPASPEYDERRTLSRVDVDALADWFEDLSATSRKVVIEEVRMLEDIERRLYGA